MSKEESPKIMWVQPKKPGVEESILVERGVQPKRITDMYDKPSPASEALKEILRQEKLKR